MMNEETEEGRVTAANSNKEGARQWWTRLATLRHFKLFLLCLFFILTGVGSNVTFYTMGLDMEGYPLFLLYSTSILYIPPSFLWLYTAHYWNKWKQRKKEEREKESEQLLLASQQASDVLAPLQIPSPTYEKLANNEGQEEKEERTSLFPATTANNDVLKDGDKVGDEEQETEGEEKTKLSWQKLHLHYVGIALATVVYSAMVQYPDPHVSGSLQSILAQVSLPLTGLGARFFGEERFGFWKVLGGSVVFSGTALAVLPPVFHSSAGNWIWVLVYFLSNFPLAVQAVWQEVLFMRYHVGELHAVVWTSIYCALGMVLCFPLDMVPFLGGLDVSGLMDNQRDAFLCFFGVEPLVPQCRKGAWGSVIIFTAFYFVNSYLLALVISHEGATFQGVVGTLITPATSIYYAIPFIARSEYERLTWYVIVGLVLILAGMFLYKLDIDPSQLWRKFCCCSDQRVLIIGNEEEKRRQEKKDNGGEEEDENEQGVMTLIGGRRRKKYVVVGAGDADDGAGDAADVEQPTTVVVESEEGTRHSPRCK
ncbi:hypothetical protein QOT17_015069 [Balamuthia mandrillaris]